MLPDDRNFRPAGTAFEVTDCDLKDLLEVLG